MPGIFISYRREDSIAYAGRLSDRLRSHFGRRGQVFMDVDTIQPGEDFIEKIEQTVASCDVLIAVIGKHWLSSLNEHGQVRLQDPEDFVHLEIRTALERQIRVIPALVGGARMPRAEDLPMPLSALARRQAIEISDLNFHESISRLIDVLERAVAGAEERRLAPEPRGVHTGAPEHNGGASTSLFVRWFNRLPILWKRVFIGVALPVILTVITIAIANLAPETSRPSSKPLTSPSVPERQAPPPSKQLMAPSVPEQRAPPPKQSSPVLSFKRALNYGERVFSVAFSPDGRLLASGGSDDTVKFWDVASGTLRKRLEGASIVRSLAFSRDGRRLASGGGDDTIKLWDPASGSLLHTMKAHTDSVRSVAFSPDGRLLASGGEDDTVKLWDVASRTLLHTMEAHTDSVASVAFSPDGRLLASGSIDKTIKLWDPASRTLLHTMEAHTNVVLSLAFSPDGRLLASGGGDDTVKLWDVASRTLLHTMKTHTDTVVSVAFSPDGRLVASGDSGNTIKLWDPASGTLLHTMKAHTDIALSVAFSPDGRLVASSSMDDSIKLWEVHENER